MRTTLRNLGATIAVAVTVGGGALLGAGTAAAVDIPTVTDQYLFSTSLSGFETIRGQAPYNGQLDWSSDGCSWAPDNPFGWKRTSSLGCCSSGITPRIRSSPF